MEETRILADNILRAIAAGRNSRVKHATDLAQQAGVSKSTLSQLIKSPDERNPRLNVLVDVARVLKVPLWSLFVPDFPFDAAGKTPLKSISDDGYVMLKAFEAENEMVKYSMMNAASLTLQEVNERSASEIREAAAKYNTQRT